MCSKRGGLLERRTTLLAERLRAVGHKVIYVTPASEVDAWTYNKDAKKMTTALSKTLKGTAASLYAELGSAFLTLAHEHLGIGERLAFILPATALTGSRWQPVRQLLLDCYHVEWVVVSHDPRTRSARVGLPGRHYVAFSESTRLGEALIVATRRREHVDDAGRTQFVNLRRNPDEPIEALGVARALLSARAREGVDGDGPQLRAIDTAEDAWG